MRLMEQRPWRALAVSVWVCGRSGRLLPVAATAEAFADGAGRDDRLHVHARRSRSKRRGPWPLGKSATARDSPSFDSTIKAARRGVRQGLEVVLDHHPVPGRQVLGDLHDRLGPLLLRHGAPPSARVCELLLVDRAVAGAAEDGAVRGRAARADGPAADLVARLTAGRAVAAVALRRPCTGSPSP